MPRVQTPVQSTEPKKIPLRILHGARKPGHHSFIGGGASKPTILSLEPSQATRVGALAASL
jgi:hypothetical protein